MSESVRSLLAAEIRTKFPHVSPEDARVLADATLKFNEDFNTILMRTLDNFSPLLEGMMSTFALSLLLGDVAHQLGAKTKVDTHRIIRDIRGVFTDVKNSGGSPEDLLNAIDKLREEAQKQG